MKLATTTGDFDKFNLTYEEKIRLLYNAGFRHIDFNMYEDETLATPLMKSDWREYVNSLKFLAESLGMDFVQAHSPNVNPLKCDDTWDTAVALTIRSIEVCGMLGIPNIVVHSGWADGIGKEEYFEKNMIFFSRLLPYAEENNVNICIENSTKSNMGDKYYFFTGEDMNEFIKYANHPRIKACWDTGHANCEGHQYSDIMALGENLACIHFNDNHGKTDEHLIPFMGTLPIDEVMHALLDSGYKGTFTFEACSPITFNQYWLFDRPQFENETRLLNPPVSMQENAEKMLYELGVYILKTYDCFER